MYVHRQTILAAHHVPSLTSLLLPNHPPPTQSTYGFATPMDAGYARGKGYGYSKQKEPVQVIMQGGLNGNPANYAGGQPGFNHIVQPQSTPSGVPVQGLVPPPLAGGFNPVPGYGVNGPGYGQSGLMGGGWAPSGHPGPLQPVPMPGVGPGYQLQYQMPAPQPVYAPAAPYGYPGTCY